MPQCGGCSRAIFPDKALLSDRFCSEDHAPTASGNDLVAHGTTRAGVFTGFSGIEYASVAALPGLVHWIFGRIHFSGVFFVSECFGGRVVFGKLHWCVVSKAADGKKSWCASGETEKEFTS